MTKKLKKRIKRISIGMTMSLLGITTAVVASTSFFGVEKENSYITETVAESYEEENIEIIQGTLSSEETKNLDGINVAEDGAIICDSLIQGAKENNLPDGNYTFRVVWEESGETKNKDYAVEIINFYEDVIYSLEEGQTAKTISLGDTTTEYKTLIAKYHKNLTIEKGVTVTASTNGVLTYKKGMHICVLGKLENNGTISMTARGTYNQAGEDVYLWKNLDNSYEYVPTVGGAGAVKHSYYSVNGTESRRHGGAGTNGINRQTGGGGEGAVNQGDTSSRFTTYSGAGSAGTSYSGGSGGGGFDLNYRSTTQYANDAQPNGGAGGAGKGSRSSSSWASRVRRWRSW